MLSWREIEENLHSQLVLQTGVATIEVSVEDANKSTI